MSLRLWSARASLSARSHSAPRLSFTSTRRCSRRLHWGNMKNEDKKCRACVFPGPRYLRKHIWVLEYASSHSRCPSVWTLLKTAERRRNNATNVSFFSRHLGKHIWKVATCKFHGKLSSWSGTSQGYWSYCVFISRPQIWWVNQLQKHTSAFNFSSCWKLSYFLHMKFSWSSKLNQFQRFYRGRLSRNV